MTDWAPIVYARVRHHDHWWRAVPGDLAGLDWVPAGIRAVVAAGHELDLGPRFLAAHRAGRRLVGVACLARELGTGMDDDAGGRPLYCFVGWLEQAPGGGAVPELAALRARYPDWAGREYRRWVGPDWSAPAHEVPRARTAPYGPPPWGGAAAPAAGPAVPLRVAGGGPEVWPAAEADLLWAAALAGPEPVTAVIGLRSARRVRPGVTHATAEDVTARQVPDPPAAPPPGAPPAAVRDPGYLRRLARTARRLLPRRFS